MSASNNRFINILLFVPSFSYAPRCRRVLDVSNVVYTDERSRPAGAVRYHPAFITAARSGRAKRNPDPSGATVRAGR